MGGEKFLVGLRGVKIFDRVSDHFSGPFSRFSNRFSCQINIFSGAVSFCRGAALSFWRCCRTPGSPIRKILGYPKDPAVLKILRRIHSLSPYYRAELKVTDLR